MKSPLVRDHPPTTLPAGDVRPESGLRPQRADLLAILALGLTTLAFFWPMIHPGSPREYIVDGDFSHQFFPFRAFEAAEWWAGRIPLWNPYMFAGHPFQADIQTAVFYPLALINAILLGRNGLPFTALEGEIVVHTFLAAVFTYVLALKLTRSRVGALIAALAFGFGGFITSYPAQQLALLETAVWLPLIVLCLELSVERPIVWGWLGAASLAFGVALLAGHTQTGLFIAYATEGYLLWRLWHARVRLRPSALALVGYPLLTAAIAAIQLIPTTAFLGQSSRENMDYATAAHGYQLSSLWEVFVPLWHDEKALSVGVVALFLAVIGAFVSRREPLVYWTGAGLLALPLSTGGATPLFWLLYQAAPGWNLFRDQERVIYIFSLAASLLAARGVAELQRIDLPALVTRRWTIAAGVATAVALLFFALGAPLGETSGLQNNLGLDALVLAIVAGVLFSRLRSQKWTMVGSAILILLIGVEAFAINFGNNLGPTNPDPRPRLAATAQFMRQLPEPFRVRGISEVVFPSDYGAMLDTPTIGGDTPIEPLRIHEMLNADADWRVWQILNVKYFLSTGDALAGLKLVFQDGPLKTFYMGDSLPRAWAVTSVEVAHDAAEARQMILAPGYHPGNIVVLEQPPSIGPIAAGPRPDVKITHIDSQRVAIDANATVPAMLVLADDFYPDWRAYRDGQPVTIFRANYLAMAFELPVGQHHFEIVYRPTPFYAGAAISAIALLGLLAYALRGTWQSRLRLSAPTWWKRIQSPTWWGAAIVLVGASFGLRVHAVAAPNLTGDEWFMLRNHDQGPLWIIHQAHTFEPHPLAYYLGLASWIEVAGRTEFAMRFPSVAFGALLTAALIALGRQLLGSRIGLIAGLIAAINPYQIAESQNARNYEMVAALSAIASLLFLRALRRGERRDWIRYGVAMFLALNTHYDAALVFGAHIAYFCGRWLLARHSRRGTYDADVGALDRRWLFTTSAVGVAFFVWMLWAWPALAAYHGYFPNPVGIDQVLLRSLATFSLGSVVAISAAVPLFALALVGAAWLIISRPDRGWFLLLYVLLPIGAVSILFLARPMFDERYLIVLAPGYLVLLAAGIEGLLRRVWPLGILALAAVVALTVPRISQTYASELTDRGDYREMAAWVGTFGTPDDPIVATGHGQAQLFSYYYHGPQPVQIVDQAANVPSVLAPNLNGHAGLWLLPYWDNPVDLAGLDDLGQQAAPVADRWFTGARALYFASPVPLKLDPDLRGTWAGKLSLSGVDVGSGNVTPGDAVAVGLHWTNGASFATPKLSLRLYDTLGAIVAQSDEPLGSNAQLAPGTGVTRIGVFVPPTTPPGSYRLVALLYQPETGQTLPLNASSQQLDGGLVVGAVQVGVRDRPIAPGETGFNPMTPTTFGAVLTALSHDPVDPGARAGDWLSLRVLWRADGPSRPDLARTLVLRDADNHTIASVTTPIVATYPTSKWSTGQLLAERVRLQVPATATSSKNHLYLRVSGDSAHALDLGEVDVTGPTRVFTRPAVPQPDGAGFGSFATLLGTSQLPSSVTPGGTLPLTLIWAASGTPDHSFTAFVHLLDPTGQIQGQIDRPPLNGQRPTDGWVAGEYVQDDYSVPVNAGAPTGKYTIEVGLYDAASGVRVPVVLADGTKADHAVIGTVEVTR